LMSPRARIAIAMMIWRVAMRWKSNHFDAVVVELICILSKKYNLTSGHLMAVHPCDLFLLRLSRSFFGNSAPISIS
jgi:hypothetical protein